MEQPQVSNCEICQHIPEYKAVETLHTSARLPEEVYKLEWIGNIDAVQEFRKCPLCGTYYCYHSDPDSESGLGYGYTDEAIRRLTPEAAIHLLKYALRFPFWAKRQLQEELDLLLARQVVDVSVPIPDLTAGLKDKNVDSRIRAAWTLGRIGRDAKRAVPELIEALSDENPIVRLYVAEALGKIGVPKKDIVPALINALHDKEAMVRISVAEALWNTGTRAKRALFALNKVLNDTHYEVHETVATILGSTKGHK